MLYYAYDKRDVGKRAPKDKKLSLSGLKRMNEKMMEMMKAREEKRVHSYDCDLYYYESTIPESGMSIFAGKNYSKGEEIVRDSNKLCVDCFLFLFFPVVCVKPINLDRQNICFGDAMCLCACANVFQNSIVSKPSSFFVCFLLYYQSSLLFCGTW